MRSLGVVPVKVLDGVGPCRRYAVIGHQVHPPVLRAAPQPFDKHVIPPGTFAIHGELAALLECGHGGLFRRELTTLTGVDDFRFAEFGKRFLNDLPGSTYLRLVFCPQTPRRETITMGSSMATNEVTLTEKAWAKDVSETLTLTRAASWRFSAIFPPR
jgi:hypothetical protein